MAQCDNSPSMVNDAAASDYESVLPHTYEKFLLGTIELWNVHMLWLNVITPQAWLMMRLLQIM